MGQAASNPTCGQLPEHANLSREASPDLLQSTQSGTQEKLGTRPPPVGKVPTKLREDETANGEPDNGKAPNRVQMARRPAFKCPRHRKGEGI